MKRLAGLLLLMLVLASCDRSMPTEPRATVPTPEPTPSAGPLSGDWTGTMRGCGSVSASVTQYGSSVVIKFTTPCPVSGFSFQGSLNGDALSGRVSVDRPLCPASSAPSSGSATPSHIRLETDRISGATPTPYWTCPGLAPSTIDLTR